MTILYPGTRVQVDATVLPPYSWQEPNDVRISTGGGSAIVTRDMVTVLPSRPADDPILTQRETWNGVRYIKTAIGWCRLTENTVYMDIQSDADMATKETVIVSE